VTKTECTRATSGSRNGQPCRLPDIRAVGFASLAIGIPTQSGNLAGLEALVVDDETDVRELISEHLRNRGLRVSGATDGRGAAAAVEREPARYRLVITDLHLPGVDGLEVLRVTKAANPSCFVVIVTGYASLDSAIQAVRLGAYDYLTKPFSLGQLDVLLQRVQDRLALEDENRRLLRQLGQRESGTDARSQILGRLDAIEARLTRIEQLLRDPREHPSRS
jgi:two-component system response regulator AtoC